MANPTKHVYAWQLCSPDSFSAPKSAESSPRRKDDVPRSSPLLNVCGLHGQPIKALGDVALDSKKEDQPAASNNRRYQNGRTSEPWQDAHQASSSRPQKLPLYECACSSSKAAQIRHSSQPIVEINWPYLAAALVACYCAPAPPVESIRSPACEQTELATSSRYLPLAIGGTCSPILEE